MERQNDKPLNEDAKLLIRYLEQYRVCRIRERALMDRLRRIEFEAAYPISGINLDGMPRGNAVGSGMPCSMAIRIDEIECKIKEQREKTRNTMLDIMDILDFLPANEIERNVLEARYIDCYSWTKTCRIVHMSRTPANNHLRAGLAKLLEFKRVQKILADFKTELEKEENAG